MACTTLAPHSIRPSGGDKINDNSHKAKEAAVRFGEDAVINSTLGECIDESGRLMVLPVVEETMRGLGPDALFRYAPITGVPGFREAVEKSLLGDDNRGWILEAVPTPGGCGALRNMIWNFLESGESAITTEYHWGPVKKICAEHDRKLETFRMFDEAGGFNLAGLRAKAREVAARQPRILLILNTPGNNPTGHSMTRGEMRGVVEIVRELASEASRRVTLCLDVSYIDYAGPFGETRAVFDELVDLPDNAFLTVVWSMSKSFTMCGMRSGAAVCLARSQEAADAFRNAMAFSARATWSNVVRSAQQALVDIVLDPERRARADRERSVFAGVIARRARAFLDEAAKAGLKTCPYQAGFFVTIPCADPDALVAELQKSLIFVVPMAGSVRFSVCAVTEDKCRRAPARIAQAMRAIG